MTEELNSNHPFGSLAHEYVALCQQLKESAEIMKPIRKRQREIKAQIIEFMEMNEYQSVNILNGSQTLSLTHSMRKVKPKKKEDVVQSIAKAIGGDNGKAGKLYSLVFEDCEEKEFVTLRRTENRKRKAAQSQRAPKKKLTILDDDADTISVAASTSEPPVQYHESSSDEE